MSFYGVCEFLPDGWFLDLLSLDLTQFDLVSGDGMSLLDAWHFLVLHKLERLPLLIDFIRIFWCVFAIFIKISILLNLTFPWEVAIFSTRPSIGIGKCVIWVFICLIRLTSVLSWFLAPCLCRLCFMLLISRVTFFRFLEFSWFFILFGWIFKSSHFHTQPQSSFFFIWFTGVFWQIRKCWNLWGRHLLKMLF